MERKDWLKVSESDLHVMTCVLTAFAGTRSRWGGSPSPLLDTPAATRYKRYPPILPLDTSPPAPSPPASYRRISCLWTSRQKRQVGHLATFLPLFSKNAEICKNYKKICKTPVVRVPVARCHAVRCPAFVINISALLPGRALGVAL